MKRLAKAGRAFTLVEMLISITAFALVGRHYFRDSAARPDSAHEEYCDQRCPSAGADGDGSDIRGYQHGHLRAHRHGYEFQCLRPQHGRRRSRVSPVEAKQPRPRALYPSNPDRSQYSGHCLKRNDRSSNGRRVAGGACLRDSAVLSRRFPGQTALIPWRSVRASTAQLGYPGQPVLPSPVRPMWWR